jgi:hypothetical protein
MLSVGVSVIPIQFLSWLIFIMFGMCIVIFRSISNNMIDAQAFEVGATLVPLHTGFWYYVW